MSFTEEAVNLAWDLHDPMPGPRSTYVVVHTKARLDIGFGISSIIGEKKKTLCHLSYQLIRIPTPILPIYQPRAV
jgi:hypothetical protein